MTNAHAPAELIMMGAAVGLPYAGISEDEFNPVAPVAGCRLCGRLFQTKYHRELHQLRLLGEENQELLRRVLDLNTEWRVKHTQRNHSEEEVEKFAKTGFAFTPVAANHLAPFGIFPMGNMNQEIVDGMFEAPRAPDMTHLEGGE